MRFSFCLCIDAGIFIRVSAPCGKDPVSQFRNGTVDSIKADTKRILSECGSYPNFVISSGCDIPPVSPWENIDAFFAAVDEFYQ